MIYAMRENLKQFDEGPRPVTLDEALRLNREDNIGIFRAVNEFSGPRRIVNLKRIKAWHVDIDGGKKDEQLIKIKNSPIYPSRVVESKNGYHVYFNAADATLEFHRDIIEGLIHYFGGDPKVKMVTAILREPGFYHKKDPDNPFKVREVFSLDVSYTESDMLYFFPGPLKPAEVMSKRQAEKLGINLKGLTHFLDSMDCELALARLSGTDWVRGEEYTFKPVARGRKNIIVNGKSTSCFIDENKRIGAIPGGPTIFQWLRYYGHDDKTIYRILKGTFSEFTG